MEHSEAHLQASCVAWLKQNCPALRLNVMKLDNEGLRSRRAGMQAVACGLLKGAPDLLIACQTSQAAGLFVEFKKPGQKATARQLEVHAALEKAGYAVKIIESLEAFKKTVIHHFA